jgi:hypothetical protein
VISPSSDSYAVAAPLLAPHPIVQIRDAKAPVFADVPTWDLAKSSLHPECVRVHAEKSSRLDNIQEWFEFDNWEAART